MNPIGVGFNNDKLENFGLTFFVVSCVRLIVKFRKVFEWRVVRLNLGVRCVFLRSSSHPAGEAPVEVHLER